MTGMPPRRKRGRRPYRSGALFRRGSDGLWIGRVEAGWDEQGKRRRIQVTGTDHADVAKALDRLRAEYERRGSAMLADRRITVSQWAGQWLKIVAKRNAPSTLRNYESMVRLWIEPAIGRRKLAELTPRDVRTVTDAVMAGKSANTARVAHTALSKMLADAIREGLINDNVCHRVDAPRAGASTRGAFTLEECRRILAACDEHPLGSRYRAALLMALRQGEALGLTWAHVDLDRAQAQVSWQLQQLPWGHGCAAADGEPRCGKRPQHCPDRHLLIPRGFDHLPIEGSMALVRPKHRDAADPPRIVPLLPEMVTALDQHRATVPPSPHDLVWHRDGHPIDPRLDSRGWKALLTAARVPEGRTIHWARHSAVTLLMAAGVDAKTVGMIVGHSGLATTDIYHHPDLTMARQGMGRLGELLAGPGAR